MAGDMVTAADLTAVAESASATATSRREVRFQSATTASRHVRFDLGHSKAIELPCTEATDRLFGIKVISADPMVAAAKPNWLKTENSTP